MSIQKNYLNQASRCLREDEESNDFDLYNYVQEEYPHAMNLISQVSKTIDYDINGAFSFCLRLLEDVNAHEEMAQLKPIFQKMSDNLQ